MAELPQISVIIPTYNAAEYIGQCIESVVQQYIDGIEIIVVDDCSTDNTKEIVAQYDKEQVIYHCLESNFGGPAKPRNIGVNLARGKYLIMLDSDDLLLPDSIKQRVDVLKQNENLGFVFCDGVRFSEKGDYDHTFLSQHDYFNEMIPVKEAGNITIVPAIKAFQTLAKGDYILPSGLAMHKSVFESVGLYDETVTNGQDLDMSLRIAEKFPVAYIDVIGFKQRVHENSISKKGHKLAYNRLELLEKHLNLTNDPLSKKAFKNKIAINHSIIASHFQEKGDFSRARYHYSTSLKYLFKLTVFKRFLLTLLGPSLYKKAKNLRG